MATNPVKYALPGEEQRKEMAAITTCWDQLTKLDTHARYRVIDWLRSWAQAEDPKGDGGF
jgi:hypothetical protein